MRESTSVSFLTTNLLPVRPGFCDGGKLFLLLLLGHVHGRPSPLLPPSPAPAWEGLEGQYDNMIFTTACLVDYPWLLHKTERPLTDEIFVRAHVTHGRLRPLM